MATLIRALFGVWFYVMRAAPILLATLLAIASYFTALKAGIRLWDDSPAGSADTPDYFVEQFEWLRQREAGQSRLALQGRRLTHVPANDMLYLSPVDIHRQRAGAPPLQLRAGEAKLNNMTGELTLLQSVHIARPADGQRPFLEMKAPSVTLDTDREILTARGNVRMQRGNQTLTAREVVLNQLTSELTARQDVTLQLPASDATGAR